MKEIGGYIELDTYTLPMLHEGAIALNCGRNALAYLIQAKRIKKMCIPKFLCDSVLDICKRENVIVRYYSITKKLRTEKVELDDDEWLYVVNYYGQINNDYIKWLKGKYGNIIVDNVQAYYQMPVDGIDTIYTCRKFFGVSDGAFLYTDTDIGDTLECDESYDRMRFILGRFEKSAGEFYSDYAKNNEIFTYEPIKRMSKLTENLLHGIDYEKIRKRRMENFQQLHEAFSGMNQLDLIIPDGAFMYPLYVENGSEIRKILIEKKVFVPTLWPDVFVHCKECELEYDLAKNIVPLPIDQRYDEEDMQYIINLIKESCANL